MDIRLAGAELFHADGQKDTKLIVVFRNFVNAPKNCYIFLVACEEADRSGWH
jgi:hypothetical protein